MPPELPNNQQRTLRHRAIEVIERHQEDAMRQLRRDGVPEALALAVMQRIASLCLRTLRELDVLYREYEELVAQDGRSAAHQHWLHDKATGLLMQVEAGIAALVAEAITKAKEDYRQQLSQPREVISVPAKPSRPA
jgi:hypothetical protein